jgi:two-component system phosphate regulon sensor histidine kinase PhoR
MITKDKVVGVLEAINKRNGPFTVEDQELLLALGSQAAVAIENARLFQQFDLISELVHELRTPLTSLTASVSLLQRDSLPEEKRRIFLKTMQQEITRLSEMATGYLDVARIESGRSPYHVRIVELTAVIQECIQVMDGKLQERELTLQWNPAQQSLTVQGDRDKLKQVLLNLLSNAIKYTLPGGTVSVSAEYRQDQAIIQVFDTGVGIPQECLPMLFDKFYRVPDTEISTQGSGLGLFLCKRIIEAHQGTIEVSSKKDEGSTFTIFLPASRPV